MMTFLPPLDPSTTSKAGRRFRPNPRPPVPNTGWRPLTDWPDLSGAKAISFDVETNDPEIEEFGAGWGRGRGHIIGVALATDDGFKKYFPMRHLESSSNHDPEAVLRYVREQLGRSYQPKVGHNVIYDLGWLRHEGVTVRGDIHDTWSAEKLIRHSNSATLEDCAQRYLGEGKDSAELYDWGWCAFGKGKASDELEKRKTTMRNLAKVPPELVGFYAESDVDLPLRLLPIQWRKMDADGLLDVYMMECGLLPLLVEIRMAGITVDLDAAERAYEEFGQAIVETQQSIDEIAGFACNTGSAVEVAKVFDKLHLRYPRTEKTGAPSFKGEFLKTVEHPFANLVVEIEELKKYRSTFIKGQILEANVKGKVHCTFNPLRAVTGRMSSSQPNLQQVPSRNALAKVIRKIFVPDEGHVGIGKWDYSAVESRILAHYAVGPNSTKLRQQYNDDPLTDYHQFTIDMVKSVTGLLLPRKHAKMVNFGLCIAEGELVLTNEGLVPIQLVETHHKLWDGVEWVEHDGVIYKGRKEVIQYAGLTATPDHKVWSVQGDKSTLLAAAVLRKDIGGTGWASAGTIPYTSDVPVYDILNAGPRRRFTCSGILVSNCYGASQPKLTKMLGIDREESDKLFEAFHEGLPYVRATMDSHSREAESKGYITTILGRRSYFDFWEPKYTPRGADRATPLRFEQAVKVYGPNVKRSHLHKATNHKIQGTASELMKSFLVKCWKDGIYDTIGVPRLLVHDEVVHSLRPGYNIDDFRAMREVMENAVKFRVPIRTEGEIGPSWGDTTKIER